MAELQNYYQREIQNITNAPTNEVSVIEDIMRHEIFHSTLDWQTAAQFRAGAKQAKRLLDQHRKLYERHYPQLKEV